MIRQYVELTRNHAQEAKDFSSWDLDIDWTVYEQAHEKGSMTTLGAFVGQELVGYASFLFYHDHKFANKVIAKQDAIYISPDLRGVGREFIEWIDEHLKTLGVEAVYHEVKTQVDWSSALLDKGYKRTSIVYSKEL